MSFREHISGLNVVAHRPDHNIMPDMHYHNAYEIYIAEDDRTFIVEEQLVYLKPRDVLLLKPNVIHCTVSKTRLYSLIELPENYLHSFFSDLALNMLTECFKKNIIRVREFDFEQLLSIVDKLNAENDDIWSLIQLLSILKNNMLRKTYDLKNTGSMTSYIVDYITENYKNINDLDAITDKFHISKQYLCNLFKNHTGTSIKKYINVLKIHASLELLSGKNLTMEEVAEKSGFSSLAYFSKTFKSIMGMSPLKYSKIGKADKKTT